MPAIIWQRQGRAPSTGKGPSPTFEDNFSSLRLWDGFSGTWETCPWYSTFNGNNVTGELGWMVNSNYAQTASIKSWSVTGGLLSLAADRSDKYSTMIQQELFPFLYTSPWLDTYHSFSQTYGYFEIQAKLPRGQGSHFGFWLLCFPPCMPYSELDVAETIGSQTTKLVTTGWSGATEITATSVGQSKNVVDTSAGFHIYSVLWTADTITWYFDRIQVFRATTPTAMHKPMYIIINVAIGGRWPGNPDGTTPWPIVTQVKYVRAYTVSDGLIILKTPVK